MSLVHWQFLSVLEKIHQQIQATLTELASECPQSTIWIGTDDPNWISEIKMYYVKSEIILDVQLSDVPFQDLEVQISPETAVVRAQSLLDAVEGFFSAGLLESIIPFPISVHPETVGVKLHGNTLTLTLPKSGKIDRQRLSVHFSGHGNKPSNQVHESIMNR